MGFRYGIVGFNGPRRRKKPKVVSKPVVVEVREIDLEKAFEAETELREATGGALILGCTFDPLLKEEEIEVIETIEEVSFDGLDEKREAFLICLSAREEELKLKSSKPKKKKRKYKKRKKKS